MEYKDFSSSSLNYMSDLFPIILPDVLLLPLKSKPLILISSEHEDTRFLLKTFLESSNYRIEEADNLEDSVTILKNSHPDLILLDCGIPFIGNLETIRQLREHMSSIVTPIVAVSGFALPKFDNLILAEGAEEVLLKPLDLDTLALKLSKIIKDFNYKNFCIERTV